MSPVPPRFVCDVMLGRTARWLRLLGFDVLYDNRAEDAGLKRLALAQERVLLTKDRELHGLMPRGSSRLVEAVPTRQQLEEIAAAFHLQRFALPPRCPLCNGELEAAARDSLRGRVPPYVFRTQESFQRCRRCAKIYWPGTHLSRIQRFIGAVREAADRSRR
jgi:uncharacterized protein with PIN domain